MMQDLEEKLFRVTTVLLRAVEKHTSSDTCSLKFACSTRLTTTSDNQMLVNLEGNSDDRHEAPFNVNWETSFVDLASDFQALYAEFREGGTRDNTKSFEKESASQVRENKSPSGRPSLSAMFKNLTKTM
jgi:hypothetical protein